MFIIDYHYKSARMKSSAVDDVNSAHNCNDMCDWLPASNFESDRPVRVTQGYTEAENNYCIYCSYYGWFQWYILMSQMKKIKQK